MTSRAELTEKMAGSSSPSRPMSSGTQGTPSPWRVLGAWARRWRVGRSLSDSLSGRVALVELDGQPAVARLGPHRGRALEWEATLLQWLERRDVGAPRLLVTSEGLPFVGECLVTELVEGSPVASDDDWALVAATLRRLHHVCGGWPQRPGSLSSRELLTYEQGGEVDLGAMPPAARRVCRAAWQPVGNLTTTVVHGDPRPTNVRIVDGRAVLLGWGRARVDAPIFDLVTLPRDVSTLDDELWHRAQRAASAWDAARGWLTHPTQARHLLDTLR